MSASDILGAVLAGGASRRFGTDKGAALLRGRPMIDRVIEALASQVEDLVICGRAWREVDSLADRPAGRLGPLAGLSAALNHAQRRGFGAVVCVPVDIHPLPPDLVSRLAGRRPAVILEQHSIGFWPAGLAAGLDDYLRSGRRSIRGWIEVAQAQRVSLGGDELANINFRGDLLTFERGAARRPA